MRHLLGLIVVCLIPLTAARAEDISSAIAKVESGPTNKDRIAADWLRNQEDESALQSIDALTKACHSDDADVRNASLLAIGGLIVLHEKPCPLILIELIADPNLRNRTNASGYVSAATSIPLEAMSLLVKYASHPDPELRQSILVPLARAGGDDPLVQVILRQAVHDRASQVRANAVAALNRTSADFKFILTQWLLMAEKDDWLGRNSDPEAKALESTGEDVAAIGAAYMLRKRGLDKPELMVDALLELLSSESTVVRAKSAMCLRGLAMQSPKAKELILAKDVVKRLKELLEDDSIKVSAGAQMALEAIQE
jgi:hypothetical protein